MKCNLLLLVGFGLLGWTLVGCGAGGDGSDSANGQGNGQGVPEVRKVSAEELPALDEHLPAALDGGRVRIAPPENWHRAGRSSDYLGLFRVSARSEVPRILVTVRESPFDGFSTVTAENLGQFFERIEEELHANEAQLIEPVLPMILGDTPYVRYVVAARYRRSGVERQVLETLFDGRIYKVELTVFRDRLREHRDHAYAVAAAMEFSSPSDGEPQGEAEEAEQE